MENPTAATRRLSVESVKTIASLPILRLQAFASRNDTMIHQDWSNLFHSAAKVQQSWGHRSTAHRARFFHAGECHSLFLHYSLVQRRLVQILRGRVHHVSAVGEPADPMTANGEHILFQPPTHNTLKTASWRPHTFPRLRGQLPP